MGNETSVAAVEYYREKVALKKPFFFGCRFVD